MEMNFCKDCKHAKKRRLLLFLDRVLFCTKSKKTDPVTGEESLESCAVVRIRDIPCKKFER